MPGAILLVLALIGFFLQKDADKRHEGSELIDVNI
jgi:hypothetical protein